MKLRLPGYAQSILNNYLIPKNKDTPPEVLLLTLNLECSKLLTFKRVKIIGPEIDMFPNIYALVFMSSGGGKDRAVSIMQEANQSVIARIDEKIMQERDTKMAENNAMVEADSSMSIPQKKTYLKENEPRLISHEISDATQEGLQSSRETMSNMKFGSCHYYNSEFVDFIKTTDRTKLSLLTFIKELYEKGNSIGKTIKSDKFTRKVLGVPQTFFAHSSIAGLFDDEMSTQTLSEFFARGYARRMMICYPKMPEFKRIDARSAREIAKRSSLFRDEIDSTFLNVWHSIPDNTEFSVSDDAWNMFYDYNEDNLEKASKMPDNTPESIISELKDRYRKAMRLACCIASFNHPTSHTIKLDDYAQAVEQVEYFSAQFISFNNRKPTSVEETLFYYIKGKLGTTKTEINSLPIFAGKNDTKKRRVDAGMADLEHFATDRGYELVKEKPEGNKNLYFIRKSKKGITHDELKAI